MSRKKKRPDDHHPASSSADTTPPYFSSSQVTADSRWNREAFESVVVAVILAFLFRAFEAEAFVIPTGSMAPTLRGRFMSVQCEQCRFWHQVGASLEEVQGNGLVTHSLCPMCQYPNATAEPAGLRLKSTYPGLNGDRILVNKFAYDFGEPERWDVIVFKYPDNAKQNFIKRLVGMPGETLRLQNGDVYVREADADEFRIERKPPEKVRTLLQSVHDTQYVPAILQDSDWPARWQPWGDDTQAAWSIRSAR